MIIQWLLHVLCGVYFCCISSCSQTFVSYFCRNLIVGLISSLLSWSDLLGFFVDRIKRSGGHWGQRSSTGTMLRGSALDASLSDLPTKQNRHDDILTNDAPQKPLNGIVLASFRTYIHTHAFPHATAILAGFDITTRSTNIIVHSHHSHDWIQGIV